MELDLDKVTVKYTVKEVIAVLVFLAGLVGTYVKTELNYETVKAQIVDVRRELADCQQQLAQRTKSQVR